MVHEKQEPLVPWVRATGDSGGSGPAPACAEEGWKGSPQHSPAQRCPRRRSFPQAARLYLEGLLPPSPLQNAVPDSLIW